MDKAMAKVVAEILLEHKAVSIDTKDPFRYASGALGPIYCDNRLLLGFPEHREQIINFFLKAIKDNDMTCEGIAGVATAGIPHAALIADRLKVGMCYVKASAKDHGKQNRIEGVVNKNQKFILVEDVVNSGGSSAAALDALREKGAFVEDCVAIFTYGNERAHELFSQKECALTCLCDLGTLLDVAVKKKYIKESDTKEVLAWRKDPAGWAQTKGFA